MRIKICSLVAAAAMLAGCGMLPGQQGSGGDEKQAIPQTEKVADRTTAVSTGERTAEEPGEQTAEESGERPAVSTEELTAIASRKITHDGKNLRIDITGLKRQGKIATLTWTVANLGPNGKSWSAGTKLGVSFTDYTVSGVTLIDPVNGKRYRVARNGTESDAKCVCSKTEYVDSGSSLEMYAVYGTPPPDVTMVNVEFPALGVFTDVPIS
ncbi:hypothetical protein [Microtetraspora sp. NBRC 16547]|uniref:hypothetical protein n=1 Tax=Microtetraspora sp. NBRC 16547 TaxID=3030993 RepID=UPI0024A08BA5|nr:hypothetical protein [Microtetraspora sp. NBRC 16547]GLX00508.1 hypothetical protein Misp02_45940 [Microtetraspora sp. NBRC 16547]